MKSMSTLSAWVGAGLFLFLLFNLGILFKLIIGLIVIRILIYAINVDARDYNIDKLEKDKSKLPAPLAEKLAKRNKRE